MKKETSIKDWTEPDAEGDINVPDRLDKLLNRIGFQLRLVTISGLNEIECLARMVKGADEHAMKEAIKFKDWCEKNSRDLDYQYEVSHTTEELYSFYNQEQNSQNKIVK